jgi:hypothetical protein
MGVALCVAVGFGLTACGPRRKTDAQAVRAALARTAAVPRGFVYSTDEAGRKTVVRGQIDDDLRYKADLALDGTPVFEEVAVDDAAADRFLDERAMKLLLRPGMSVSGVPMETWLIDAAGAPSLLSSAGARRVLGDDPVIDALTVFRHVDQVLTDGGGAHRFNPDSLDYRPQEDPFPRPAKGSGLIRYDFERAKLPRPEDAVGGGARAVPGPANFRRVSVYVRDGRVVQVLETMDIPTRIRELRRLYNLGLPDRGTADELVPLIVTRLNQLRRATGGDPIRLQSLSVQFLNLGKDVAISLPGGAGGTDLSVFRNRGKAATRGAGTTTTTTASAVSG